MFQLKKISLLLFVFLCGIAAFSPTDKISFKGCADGSEDIPSSNEVYEYEVLVLTNKIRMKRALQPLKMQTDLHRAARYHTADMSQDRYMNHNTYDRDSRDRLVQVCDIWTRMKGFYDHTLAAAENVAEGYPTPSSVMKGWMDSKGHRKNILNGDYRAAGIAYIKESGQHPYWGQSFGAMREDFHLLINLDALSTQEAEVSLYAQGEWREMRLSNDGKNWTKWKSFRNETDWTLDTASEAPQKQVFVEVKDGNGNSYRMEDTIRLEKLE